jgi:hypothetical protein
MISERKCTIPSNENVMKGAVARHHPRMRKIRFGGGLGSLGAGSRVY